MNKNSQNAPKPKPEHVRPFQNILIGFAIPFGVILLFGVVGAAMGLTEQFQSSLSGLKTASMLGLVLVLLGGLEIAFGILFFEGRFINRMWILLGFILSWSLLVFFVVTVLP